MEGRLKDPVPSRAEGDNRKQVDPTASGTFGFHFREHVAFFKRMMLRGLCLFQIPFSFMISEATSSWKSSMISSRENCLFIPLQSHSTLFVLLGACGMFLSPSLCSLMPRCVSYSSFAPLAAGRSR